MREGVSIAISQAILLINKANGSTESIYQEEVSNESRRIHKERI
jgi:hypothetical protein